MSKKILSILVVTTMLLSFASPLRRTVKAAVDDGLIISEYIEGTSYNKAIEIYNGTLSTVDLSNYRIWIYYNGSASYSSIALSGTLSAGDIFVIAHSSANAAILAVANATSGSLNFNGNDVVALVRLADGSFVDVFGQIGNDPGSSGWGGITANHTLVRKSNVVKGDPDGNNAFDPTLEWDSYPADTVTYLGSHSMTDDGFVISEYIEGSSYNKAIELYNGRGLAIDLSNYMLALYSNGSPSPTASVTLSGTLAAGDTYVIAHGSADLQILAIADLTNSSVINFNGDDAIALIRVSDGSYVDVFGQIGFDPGSYWGVSPNTTQDHTLVRKSSVVKGDSVGNDAFDPSIEWDFYAVNTFTYLGWHVMGNNPPALDWTGEAGYESDGVEPDSGDTDTTFVYRVKYTDTDNDPPMSGYPKVHILKDSVEIVGSPFAMNEVDAGDTDYSDGKLYAYSTTLSAGNTYTYYFEAKDSNNASATGSPTSAQSGPVVSGDGVPPVIFGTRPYRFSSTYELRPVISAEYSDDGSGIDASTAYIKLDGTDKTSEATITATYISYLPSSDLPFGKHTVEVGVRDLAGNSKTIVWYFNIISQLSNPTHYFGDLHSHTSYSDGALTPYDAFTYARDIANIDVLAITDHSNSLNSTEWEDTKTQANNFTESGRFVALAGFEYTHTVDGHINVYESDSFVSRNDVNYDTIPEFYSWLKTQPDNVFAQFNHPFTTDDFLGFAYDFDIDSKITLQEVGNGSPPYSYARLEDSYIYALDKGWHVGATNGQDNHSANWGYPPNNLTGIVAENLTKAEILDALKLMRVYSTEDRNLKMSFLANGYWMGTTIPAEAGDTIEFSIYVDDPDSTDTISSIQIISSGGGVLFSISPNSQSYSGTFSYSFAGGGKWFYLKAVEADGDIAISSPVWTPVADTDLKVTGITTSPKIVLPNKPTTITATLMNAGLISYTGLSLSFYDGDPDGAGVLIGTNLVDLEAGSLVNSSVTWTPTTGGIHTIYAVLETPSGDEESDNTQTLRVDVVQTIGKTVLIDRYHKNDYTSTTGLSNLSEFADFLALNGYNVIDTCEPITSTILTGVDVLVITYPQSGTGRRDLSSSEMDAIRSFVSNGGALLFTGKSNYNEDPTRYNDFLTSMGIGVVINHDNIYDDYDNYGYQWGVNLRTFPDTPSGIGEGISNVRFFSGATLIKPDKTPLVSDPTNKIEVLAYANETSYDEDDTPEGLTHVGAGYFIYSYRSNPEGSDMPAMAVQELPNGSRVAVLGRAIFSNYEFGYWLEGQAACNNEAFTLNLVDWLCKYDRVMTIAEARKDDNHDGVPDRLGQKVTVRGTVTSGTGKFFDVIYLQDETGGITVFGTIPSDKIINEGAVLQVTGVIDHYNGDTELQFTDFSSDFIWVGWTDVPEPRVFTTGALNLEENEGWLVRTYGTITQIIDSGTCVIDDGSGPVIVFIDGYIGTLPVEAEVGDTIVVIGLSGEYSGGHRIRVRKQSDIITQFTITQFTITASSNSGGTISPSGIVTVQPNGAQSFVITPDTGYHIVDVKVDGVSQGPLTSYTFENVTSNHTIEAVFEINTYTITASVNNKDWGSITPSGAVIVTYGGSQTFTIKANHGYFIYRVLVDKSPIKIANSSEMTYTFTNVSSNHTISVEFMKAPDITPPTLTLPTIDGVDLNTPGSTLYTNSSLFTFLVEAHDDSGIARMVVKVNGLVQIDKNNLDPTIYLSEGENTVEVTVYDTYGNYVTKSFKVYSDTKPPVVNLTVPEYTSTSPLPISGFIYDESSGIKKLLINNTEYLVGSSGKFEASIPLEPGVNTLTVKATDKLGNTTTKIYSVNYTPSKAKTTIITLKIDSPYITVNGLSQKIDAQGSKPIIKNGRTLLPIRTLIESVGGTIEWDATEKKVSIYLDGHSIILWIGKTTALVDGSKATLDVAPEIINGRTYLPLRFISENLGATVNWDADTKTITIYYWQ